METKNPIKPPKPFDIKTELNISEMALLTDVINSLTKEKVCQKIFEYFETKAEAEAFIIKLGLQLDIDEVWKKHQKYKKHKIAEAILAAHFKYFHENIKYKDSLDSYNLTHAQELIDYFSLNNHGQSPFRDFAKHTLELLEGLDEQTK